MKYFWFLMLIVVGLIGCTQSSVDPDRPAGQAAEAEIVGPAFVLFFTEN